MPASGCTVRCLHLQLLFSSTSLFPNNFRNEEIVRRKKYPDIDTWDTVSIAAGNLKAAAIFVVHKVARMVTHHLSVLFFSACVRRSVR